MVCNMPCNNNVEFLERIFVCVCTRVCVRVCVCMRMCVSTVMLYST